MSEEMLAFLKEKGITSNNGRKEMLLYMMEKLVERVSYVNASMSIGLFPEDNLIKLRDAIQAYIELKCIIDEDNSDDNPRSV